jgi:hypothetical protein
MVLSTVLLALGVHVEVAMVNLGFARCATFNSLLTGLGVDVCCRRADRSHPPPLPPPPC